MHIEQQTRVKRIQSRKEYKEENNMTWSLCNFGPGNQKRSTQCEDDEKKKAKKRTNRKSVK